MLKGLGLVAVFRYQPQSSAGGEDLPSSFWLTSLLWCRVLLGTASSVKKIPDRLWEFRLFARNR